MKNLNLLLGLFLLILLVACGQSMENRDQEMEKAGMMDSTSNAFISSSAAVEDNKDSTRQFIRTADLKFKVKSVIESTYDIENITKKQGGFVTYTQLKSDVNRVKKTAISTDSTLETTHYTVKNAITLRVPNTKLDTTLKAIAQNIDFLDYRIIEAEDVALQILSNKLKQERSEKNEERLTDAIDNRGEELIETTLAEEHLVNKQKQADEAMISNLSLSDKVNFSTVNLSIYQRQSIKREVVANNKNIDAYEPSFGTKIMESLQFGWNILATFFLFIVKFWGIFLLGLLVYFLYRRFRKKEE